MAFFLLAFLWSSPELSAAALQSQSITINVNHYGAVPDDQGDDRAAIQAAIDAAVALSTAGDVTVAFTPGGVYRVGGHPDSQFSLEIDQSNQEILGRLTLEGNGAEIVVTQMDFGLLHLTQCPGLRIQNLSIDVDPLPYMDGVVTLAVPIPSSNSVLVWVNVVRGISDPEVFNTTPYDHWGWLLDPTVPGRPKMNSNSHFIASNFAAPQSGTMSFIVSGGMAPSLSVGDRLTYHFRKGTNLRIDNSDNVTISNVESYGSGLMFIVAEHSAFLTISQCGTKIRTGRWRSGNGDGIHTLETDDLSILNCHIEGISDDAIHIKQSAGFTISGCTFTNKRRHAILLDGDGVTQDSTSGWIADNVASYNGGSFFVPSGGAYLSTVFSNNTIRSNHLAESDSAAIRARIVTKLGNGLPLVVTNLSNFGSRPTNAIGQVALGDPNGVDQEWDLYKQLNSQARIANFGVQFAPDWMYLAEGASASNLITEFPNPGGAENDQHRNLLSQKWTITNQGNYFTLMNNDNGLYLTVNPAVPGAPVQGDSVTLQGKLYGSDSDRQLWRLDPLND